ncbi:hypothetical protein EYR38_004960 [Pleurotus pulmonarius]|nr:hypothetical protein EYR38_004960 [Pleurotus pulmonarius]
MVDRILLFYINIGLATCIVSVVTLATYSPLIAGESVYQFFARELKRSVYAINLRKRWVLLVLLAVWLGQVGSMAYSVSGSGATDTSLDAATPTKWRCNLDTSAASHFQLGFIVPLVIFDCTAFMLTFLGLSTSGDTILPGPPILSRSSISARVLRDGLFYFLILCVVNVAWVISSKFLDPDFQNIVHLPSSALTVVLMNRMILHTRGYLEPSPSQSGPEPISLPEFGPAIRRTSESHERNTIDTNSGYFRVF